MAFENTSKKLAADLEAVAAQVAALQDEMAGLGHNLSSAAQTGARAVKRDIAGMTRSVSRAGHAADRRLEGAVAANPYVALGLAFGAGILLGAAARR